MKQTKQGLLARIAQLAEDEKALRTPCSGAYIFDEESGEDFIGACELDQPQDCTEHDHSYCDRCKNRRWVPEPDLSRACWEITKWLWDEGGVLSGEDLMLETSYEEAVIGLAEAWLEKRKP